MASVFTHVFGDMTSFYATAFKSKQSYKDIVSLLEFHRPETIVLETDDSFQDDDQLLRKCGYFVHQQILDAFHITRHPYHCTRCYIVGFRYEIAYERFSLDFSSIKPENHLLMSLYLDKSVDASMYYNERTAGHLLLFLEKFVRRSIHDFNTVYQLNRYYVRQYVYECPPFQTGNPIVIRDTKGIRRLTPHEWARFLNIPDEIFDMFQSLTEHQQYKQLEKMGSVAILRLIKERLLNN